MTFRHTDGRQPTPRPERIDAMPRLVPASIALVSASTPMAAHASPPAWRANVETFAATHFKHTAWGFAHSRRDYASASASAAEDHAALDDDVLYAAAMSHDIAAFPPWEDAKKDHADRTVESSPAVSRDAGFPAAKIPAVSGATRTHMFDRKPVAPEAVYSHDADALDWSGAIGVYRLVSLVDTNGGQ
ncbi:hypothetical protein OY671_008869, partial [Metschnikowia pulcherrima]